VVFAKLARLSRNVDLLRSLVASGVDLVFCDLPHVPAGAMGRFLLTQMASVAELEAGLISERTKAALAAAKARGVKLGNPNGARALRGKQTGNSEAVAAIKLKAQAHAENLRAILADIRGQGITSIRKTAEELNRRSILAPRGGEWQATTVVRLMARIAAAEQSLSRAEQRGAHPFAGGHGSRRASSPRASTAQRHQNAQGFSLDHQPSDHPTIRYVGQIRGRLVTAAQSD
jgi:hypothetical protein